MKRASRHKDVEFAVDDASGHERVFKTAAEAAAFAIALAVSDGEGHAINVLVHSEAGARWYRGTGDWDEDDLEASVFERIIVKAEAIGHVW